MSKISIWAILYAVLLQPLELFFEIVYKMTNTFINNPGYSIIVLSIVMNILVFPLYRRADAIQDEERKAELRLKDGVQHIKKTFKGDERMMILQTYYRQNNYKPTYALRSAASLLLQIPFFIAAYRFLSSLELLNGFSFGLISDMSKPDGLITIAGLSINVLPVIMTIINIISSAVYSKDYSAKTKVQLYVTALFFLVFLYKSPAGLVFYWTLNNAFSLVKTVVMKTKNPKKTLYCLLSIIGIAVAVFGIVMIPRYDIFIVVLLIYLAFMLQVPLLLYKLRQKKKTDETNKISKEYNPDKKTFILSGLFMSLLTGSVISSQVVTSSPQEFVFINTFYHPIWYVIYSFCLAFGTFVVWCSVFYAFASDKGRYIIQQAMCIICACGIVNYLFFKWNRGKMSNTVYYYIISGITDKKAILNTLAVFAVAATVIIVSKKLKKVLPFALLICVLSFTAMTAYNSNHILKSVSEIDNSKNDMSSYSIKLSKEKENVIVLMMDRAQGCYFPYIINEFPELKEQFDGFTYYNNVASFGGCTNFASPALFGGYEYTPVELNSRSDEKLVEKHNESLKVLPVMFEQNGFDVTVTNPSYAGYQEIPDLSIYNDYPNINAYYTGDYYTDKNEVENIIKANNIKFYLLGVMKTLPVSVQPMLYDHGSYYQDYGAQKKSGKIASGMDVEFLNEYSTVNAMPSITNADGDNKNFYLIVSKLTHSYMYLQEPDYSIRKTVDNSFVDYENDKRFVVNGNRLKMENESQISSYQPNVLAYKELAKWFDSLKKLGVYDNTRIIIVADHGFDYNQIDELVYNLDGKSKLDAQAYFPLLLVKDFNSHGFKASDEFMTNADVATLSTQGVIKNPVNPFTGKKIDNSEKYAHDQYIINSAIFSVEDNNGTQFIQDKWYSVHDSIWEEDNWKLVSEKAVLTNEDIK